MSPSTIDRAENGAVPHPTAQRKLAAALTLALGEDVDALDLWPLTENAA